jgi:hypothetical protein
LKRPRRSLKCPLCSRTVHAGTEAMTRTSLLCSRSAHAGTIRFEIKGGAPSTGAIGATCVPSLKESQASLEGLLHGGARWEKGASRRGQGWWVRMTRAVEGTFRLRRGLVVIRGGMVLVAGSFSRPLSERCRLRYSPPAPQEGRNAETSSHGIDAYRHSPPLY